MKLKQTLILLYTIGLFFLLPFSIYSFQIRSGSLVKGLVAHWTLDKSSIKATSPDTILADLTPNGNDGTNHGAVFTTDRKGNSDRAMSFDGVDDYVDCGSGESLDITDAITVGGWVKIPVLWSEMGCLYPGWLDKSSAESSYGFRGMTTNNTIRWSVYDNDNVGHYVYSNLAMETGIWYFIVGTYNGSVQKLYMNGVLQDSQPSWSGTINSVPTVNVMIGKFGSFMNGFIDEVRIYNRALSQAEVILSRESYRPEIKITP